jgi:hypothetical protein
VIRNGEGNAKVTGLCSVAPEIKSTARCRMVRDVRNQRHPNPTNPLRYNLILDEGSVASPAHAGADRLLGGMCQVDMCAFGDACARGEGPSSRSARPVDAATAPDAPFCMSAGGGSPTLWRAFGVLRHIGVRFTAPVECFTNAAGLSRVERQVVIVCDVRVGGVCQ